MERYMVTTEAVRRHETGHATAGRAITPDRRATQLRVSGMVRDRKRKPRAPACALGAAEQERVVAHDTTSSLPLLRVLRLGLRGAGRAAGSATPSTTLAFAPASRAAINSLIISSDRSSCSSVMAFTPPECSNFISRGTSKAHIFMYAAGCCLRTFSIAAAPCFLKSAASASRKSLLNDLRVASKDPPGFPDHPGANLPLMRLGM